MKAIMVMFDSLNRHMLPPYGCDWVHAPNFERLAQRTVRFENAYAGSMPCMPARRELHTGRYNFLHRSWGPLEPFDDSMPEILKTHGVYTHLSTDHQHYFEDGGATYHHRYNSWEFARGQEGDAWKGHVADPEIPPTLKKMPSKLWRQEWINRGYMQREADQPQTQVFDNGLHFIRTNHNEDRWFVQIEAFDPHEPFFTQPHYKDLYPDGYQGRHADWPDAARLSESPAEVQHIRNEYAALLSMCDHNLGRVLDLMDEFNLWDDTLLIVCTDHGFMLGEHDWWAKNVMPWYNETVHIPLFIWDPRSQAQDERRQSLVQTIDLAPTLLEFFGIERSKEMLGKALLDVIASDQPVHEAGLFGAHGGHVNITDGRYVYMRAPHSPQNSPLYDYTLLPTHMWNMFQPAELQNIQLAEPFPFSKGCRTMKIEARSYFNPYNFGTLLFDLENDPGQLQPIVDEAVERRMIGLMVELMRQNDAPPEQYERLGLPSDGVIRDEHLLLQRQQPLVQQMIAPAERPADVTSSGVYNLDTPLKQLLAHEPTRQVIAANAPMLLGRGPMKINGDFSLRQIGTAFSFIIPIATLKTIAAALEQIRET